MTRTRAVVGGNEGVAPRRAAFQVLRAVREGRQFEQALDEGLSGLVGADRRLAHELAAGSLRQRAVLDAALVPLAHRGWEAVPLDLRDVLRVGAYQLTMLDRVPAHAAVSATVALARELGGRPAGGFVNAVLRQVARQAQAPAAASSLPTWLLERWQRHHGTSATEQLRQHADRRPVPVLQPARESLAAIAARLDAAGIAHRPAPFGAGIEVPGARPASLPGYAEGAFMVQDPAQALVVRYASAPAGGLVFDACAAPGGKAIAMGRDGASVVAGDRSWTRLQRLAENIARAGSARVWPVLADAAAAPVRDADLVLLDAPCLGTGTLARRPDARWRLGPSALDDIVPLQRALLEATAGLVRLGGHLVYATCSIEPEENEQQVNGFLERHAGFVRDPGPAEPGHLTPEGDLFLLPHRDGTDGAYAARLRRSA